MEFLKRPKSRYLLQIFKPKKHLWSSSIGLTTAGALKLMFRLKTLENSKRKTPITEYRESISSQNCQINPTTKLQSGDTRIKFTSYRSMKWCHSMFYCFENHKQKRSQKVLMHAVSLKELLNQVFFTCSHLPCMFVHLLGTPNR